MKVSKTKNRKAKAITEHAQSRVHKHTRLITRLPLVHSVAEMTGDYRAIVRRTAPLAEEREALAAQLLQEAEQNRCDATAILDADSRGPMGQYFTPLAVAQFMGTFFSAFPNDRVLLLDACSRACCAAGVTFDSEVHQQDFVTTAVDWLREDMFAETRQRFNATIANPPYFKIASNCPHRKALRAAGIETSNIYTGFLHLLARLLTPNGQMVAITPRSFCNGPYFRPFRVSFLASMRLTRVHVFDSRDKAFGHDKVLQENIIFAAKKERKTDGVVVLSSSDGPPPLPVVVRMCRAEDIISPSDPDQVIHLPTVEGDEPLRRQFEHLPASLKELNVTVSTGRVVDFRAREHLLREPAKHAAPLIYPCHFSGQHVSWPRIGGRKPNAILKSDITAPLLMPSGYYVLVKRFTSKEEPRRIVACVFDPQHVAGEMVGFENHLDVFHMSGRGLPSNLAYGLAAFLNTSIVDRYFRTFIGFQGRQRSRSAALVLLALLDLRPDQPWLEAQSPLRGITPIIEYLKKHYRVKYAPNTRETIRDEAVKYFVETGIAVRNPDNPDRPTNSGNTVYQIASDAQGLVVNFGLEGWTERVAAYVKKLERQRFEIERRRVAHLIPVRLPDGSPFNLSPGGQNSRTGRGCEDSLN